MSDAAKKNPLCLVLCNVGGRDVMLRTPQGNQELRPARPRGKEILERYAEYAADILLPILQPALAYIHSQQPGARFRLILFGTDQPPGKAQQEQTDTLYFAEIAARKVPESFGEVFGRPEVQLVDGINPALHDEAYERYGQLLLPLRSPEVAACYVAPAGGIPACNMALLLQGVRYFGERLQVVYVPQEAEPQGLRIGRQIMGAFKQAAAAEHLQRLDFANALPYLQALEIQPGLLGLVAYAAQRFAFDFDSARATLEQALRDGDAPLRAFIGENLRHRLDWWLQPGDSPERLTGLLNELYWNAAITYQHHRYADFLGRVYRFQEAVLRYLVEMALGISTDLGKEVRERNQQRWEATILADAPLHAYLEASTLEGQPLDWRRIGRPAYKTILSFTYAEHSPVRPDGQPRFPPALRGKYAALFKMVNSLDELVELRHRTIIGHDFQGVSEALLLEKSPDHKPPVQVLAEIMRMLGQDVRQGDFERIARFVVERL
jgi:hypothetical protein